MTTSSMRIGCVESREQCSETFLRGEADDDAGDTGRCNHGRAQLSHRLEDHEHRGNREQGNDANGDLLVGLVMFE